MEMTIPSYWPSYLPETLQYRHGERPLHEYIDQHCAEKPDAIAFSYYGREITWKELHKKIGQLAGYLNRNEIKKGDAIGLYMQNCPQYIIAHYAIQKIGGIVVPLNPMYKESELSYFFKEAGMKGIIAGCELYSRVVTASRDLESPILAITVHYRDFSPEPPALKQPEDLSGARQTFESAHDMKDIFIEESPFNKNAEIDIWNDIGLMIFTSGTTGRPKGALLTYGSSLYKTAATAETNEMREDDRSLAIAPLCHIAGMVMGVNIPVYAGNTCYLLTRFDPETVIDAIETYKITNWYSVAPMNAAILQTPGVEKRDLTSLRHNPSTSFGMPVTKELAERWHELTKGCIMHEASYGLSETHTCDTFMPKDKIKFGSCGIPVYQNQIEIVETETGFPAAPGEKGEIAVRNPGIFKGYLNRADATAEALRDGWVFTGDIGLLDEDGYLYFFGRMKELIKCSGYSVFPEDVEALLNEHPAVMQSAVIGIPDSVRGESVKAFIVLKPNERGKVTEQDILNWSKEHMAAYKYPREIEFREELPSTSSGKVLRRLLKTPESAEVRK
ncbi:AMP-binding protein [Metabacillus idriensis]|uniref:AMP-binding protein n=1 Tax=Metabacillus idriensis TaxID=324768 RepID=A0A6I2M8E9_9BACI|nr:AMP-binding protein [Metabacillus idriensis]MCM3597579.1 AMP-binding protein [Metabacillus idriensis]MRX54500.1 AMP-binding protein [Metabacillus idriensis]